MKRTTKVIMQNIIPILPFFFILAMLMLYLVLPAKIFSIEERRYLAQWPAFRFEEVVNRSYASKIESYFSDQFPFRDFWIRVQEGSNRMLGFDP